MKNILPRILRSSVGACVLALGLGSAVADYSTSLSGLNPKGYWKLDETASSFVTGTLTNTGTTGTALNGAYYLSPLAQQEGALGAGKDPAMNFNGLNQFAETPYNAALNPSGPFTVEFWANLTNDTAGAKSGVVSRYITVAGGPTAQLGYLFFVNNGNTSWQFRVYNGTGNTTITDSSVDVQANTWYHIVGVYDGANITIYVNGVATSTSTGTVVYRANTNAPMRLGAGTTETGPSLFFPGLLDNVAIYHSVLPAGTIAAHYEAATTNAAGYNAQILADSPAVYYPMNEPALPASPVAANSGSLGSAYDGMYVFGATPAAAGPRQSQFAGMTANNNAVEMNGTSGRVIVQPLPINTDSVTYTCWVKRNGSQASFAGLMFNRPTATGLSFDGANRLSYTWNDAANTYNFNSGLTLPDGIWTFCAATITPTNAILYLGSTNGLKSATNNVAHGAHDFSAAVFNLGWDNGARYLKGTMDEAAIFDTPLDPNTISNLFYSATPAIPLLTRTPADPLYEGMTVTFTAYGMASGPVNYQWRKAGANLNGKTAASLSLTNVTTGDSGNYDVVVSFGANSVTSSVSAITVLAGPPVTFANPVSITRFKSVTATFTALAGGSVPLSYQWQKNSNDIAGATSATLTLPNITTADAASYRAKFTNPYGSNFTQNATLTVLDEANPFPALAIADGPAAYWRLNETSGTTAYDYAGGYNGTAAGAIITGSAGPQPPAQVGFESGNKAFTFNGTSTWVEAPSLNFNTNTMTFAAWIKVNAYHPTDLAGIVFSRGTAGAAGLHMVATGELRYHWEGGSHYGFASSLIVPQGQWVFVALVVEPTRATLYMNDGNGLVSAVNNTTHNVIPGTDPMFIGRDRTDRVFDGDIDEAMVFKRSLSSAEIQNLSLMGVSGPTAPQLVTLPESQSVMAGQSAAFSVGAIGAIPFTYQWKLNGANIAGATKATLTIPSAYFTDAGSYSCGVTNSVGGTNSPAATLAVSPYPQFANLTNGLVLHLKFDGNELDSSGRTNHGTIVGETNYTAGKLGSAFHYRTDVDQGSYNYVTLGTPADLQFGATTDFSVAYWVMFTGLPGDLPFLCSAGNSYGNFGLTFAPSYGDGGWSYYVRGVTTGIGLYGPVNSINDGNWHSLVHTFTRAGNALTYLDGALVDTRSMTAVDDVDTGLPINIGQDPTGTYAESGEASIDDIGVWRRALTPPEAQAIYLVAQDSGRSFDSYGPLTLTLHQAGADLELIWQAGTLESSDHVEGPYLPVIGASSPYRKVTTSGDQKYYRVKL